MIFKNLKSSGSSEGLSSQKQGSRQLPLPPYTHTPRRKVQEWVFTVLNSVSEKGEQKTDLAGCSLPIPLVAVWQHCKPERQLYLEPVAVYMWTPLNRGNCEPVSNRWHLELFKFFHTQRVDCTLRREFWQAGKKNGRHLCRSSVASALCCYFRDTTETQLQLARVEA